MKLVVLDGPSEFKLRIGGRLVSEYSSKNGEYVFADAMKASESLCVLAGVSVGNANHYLTPEQNFETLNLSRVDKVELIFDEPVDMEKGVTIKQVYYNITEDGRNKFCH